MDKNVIKLLHEYHNTGLHIELETVACGYVTGVLIRGKRDNFHFNRIYDWYTMTMFFHDDIYDILCDFKVEFERRKKEHENV